MELDFSVVSVFCVCYCIFCFCVVNISLGYYDVEILKKIYKIYNYFVFFLLCK